MSTLTVTWLPRISDELFEQAAPLLQRVVDRAVKGEFTVEDMRRMAQRGSLLIGLAWDGRTPVMAAAVELVRYPRLTTLNVMAISGRGLREVADEFFDELKAFARSAGAKRIEASGSPAMARLLRRRLGFTTLYEKVWMAL